MSNLQVNNNTKQVYKYLSRREVSNRLKGTWLEDSTLIGCEDLNLTYEDLTSISNFKNKLEHHTPDIIINNHIIELKNWNNTFKITMYKARTQILSRFLPYWNNTKVLIISNPNWSKHVKEWLRACGIRIYELGYFVTNELFINGKAISDVKNILKDILGYSYNIYNIIKCPTKYRTEPIINVNRTETDRIETLNQYLIDKNISKIDKKEVLPKSYNRLYELFKIILGGIMRMVNSLEEFNNYYNKITSKLDTKLKQRLAFFRRRDKLKIISTLKDHECFICRKLVPKGSKTYSRTVCLGINVLKDNEYGYYTLYFCSLKCLKKILQLLTKNRMEEIVLNNLDQNLKVDHR